MLVIITGIFYFIDNTLLQNGLILVGIIVVVGLLNGYIFDTVVKKSITYIVVIGEALVGIIFVVMYFTMQNDLANNTGNSGLEGLGLIFVFIILFVVLILGFVGFIVLGIGLYIPALIGKSFKKQN